MLALVAEAEITPEVHSVHRPEDFADAIGTMRDGTQFGKICVDMRE